MEREEMDRRRGTKQRNGKLWRCKATGAQKVTDGLSDSSPKDRKKGSRNETVTHITRQGIESCNRMFGVSVECTSILGLKPYGRKIEAMISYRGNEFSRFLRPLPTPRARNATVNKLRYLYRS
jgi:hypothetical protein